VIAHVLIPWRNWRARSFPKRLVASSNLAGITKEKEKELSNEITTTVTTTTSVKVVDSIIRMNNVETIQFMNWAEQHKDECFGEMTLMIKSSADNGIGIAVDVTCLTCQKTANITDYDMW
jgi:hypothetical protein